MSVANRLTAGRARVTEGIVTRVQLAGLGPGDKIPTERQLAEELGVTRTTVRAALADLEASGLLSRQVGRGTFLRQPPGSGDATDHGPVGLTDVSPADVMAVRLLLEPQIMTTVVVQATERDFAEMDRCLTGGDGASTYDEFEEWDMALHRSFFAATRNPLLVRLYASVESARRGQLWGALKRRVDSAANRASYCREHHEIVDALQARDADRAFAAMRAHLASVGSKLLGRPV